MWYWPEETMDFWKIDDSKNVISVRWSHDYFLDYKKMSEDFYHCGYETMRDIVESGHNNLKTDQWFLVGIFLLRQSIELGLKALICRISSNGMEIQNLFLKHRHDLSGLFKDYYAAENKYLLIHEKEWLNDYLEDIEDVDKKSDVFRFPFEDEFLSKFRNRFLDCVAVANNMIQAYGLISNCLNQNHCEYNFDATLSNRFFVFSSHGIGNCYLWQDVSDSGFHVKVNGYIDVIKYIYNLNSIAMENKLFPILFMQRNTIELCLKRIFYSRVDNGVSRDAFFKKRKSHLIKKELWKNVRPVIEYYAAETGSDLALIDTVESLLLEIDSIDKNGDTFRYPTTYSLEYKFDNKTIGYENVYEYFLSIINFLDCCDSMLDMVVEYQDELRREEMYEGSYY